MNDAGDSAKTLHRIWKRTDVMAASLAINVLGFALPIAILQMYDRVIRYQSLETLSVLCLLTVGAFALEFALRVLRARIMNAEGARYDHRENCGAYEKVLGASTESFRSESSGSHTEKFQAIQTVRAYYCQAATLIADAPFIFLFVCLIGAIAGWMVLVPLTLMVVFGGFGLVVSRRLAVESGRREQSDVKRHNFLVESVGGISTIKMLGAESLMQRRYERLQEEASDAFGVISRVNAQTQLLASELAQIASVVTVLIGAVAIVSSALTIGGLAATTILTGRLLQPVLKGLNLWTRYSFIRQAEAKIERLQSFAQQMRGDQPMPKRRHASLKLEHINFRYAKSDWDVVRDLTLEVPAKTFIGLTGQTSSGRSTLLKIMNGTLTATSGRVTYDGVPFCLYDAHELRRQMALMPTTPTIYTGTLLENLTMFEDGPVKRRALALSRVLGLEDYVAGLTRGLDTELTGAGDTPMGIAQRISIIRSLARNPRVILFDTANAALDHEADRRLLAYFQRQKGRRSAVFVTDRPSYLKLCDVIYDMADGQIVQRRSVVAPAPMLAATGTAGAG